MKWAGRAILVTLVGMFVFLGMAANGMFVRVHWTREHPLINPLPVSGVRDGVIALADGRVLRPAGIQRRANVPAEEFDRAVTAVVNQGVVVVRELGDGRAFITAEPKFYNWCGTHGPWSYWAGTYVQAPTSELLVWLGYAEPDLAQAGLSPKEVWRLEGVAHLATTVREGTVRIRASDQSLRYESEVNAFAYYDFQLENVWKPPPAD